jgi:hypothetical protein
MEVNRLWRVAGGLKTFWDKKIIRGAFSRTWSMAMVGMDHSSGDVWDKIRSIMGESHP